MRLAIVEIVPLIGEQDAVLFGLAQLIREAPADMLVIVRIAEGERRHFHQFRAAKPQHVLLFVALRFRNDDDGAVSPRVGDEREPMPVLPAVASTTRPPGFSSPRFSASKIMCRAGRSFTDWPGS